MSLWTDKRTDLSLQIKDIFHQNEHRKYLIQLCIMRAQCLGKISTEKRENGVIKENKTPVKSVSKVPPHIPGDADALQSKLNGFELQVANLKMKLSTKEQAHAAEVDELREIIKSLRSEGTPGNGSGSASKITNRVTKKRPILKPAGSPLSRSSKPMSSFFANSPFSDAKGGRGNSFSGVEITSVASQASLKLSKVAPKSADDVFSPNNSSAESTPQKPKAKGKTGTEQVKDADSERSNAEISSTSVNMTVSDPEETFQSANATFDTDKDKKPKRKKIRLVSSEASKLILASHNQGLDGEGEDINSFKYYQDDNFENPQHSPGPVPKLQVKAGPVVKKKHVFKIG